VWIGVKKRLKLGPIPWSGMRLSDSRTTSRLHMRPAPRCRSEQGGGRCRLRIGDSPRTQQRVLDTRGYASVEPAPRLCKEITRLESRILSAGRSERWWAAVDSNHLPPRYQHGALPVELAAQGPSGSSVLDPRHWSLSGHLIRVSPAASKRASEGSRWRQTRGNRRARAHGWRQTCGNRREHEHGWRQTCGILVALDRFECQGLRIRGSERRPRSSTRGGGRGARIRTLGPRFWRPML
jgi:hypothetical protein